MSTSEPKSTIDIDTIIAKLEDKEVQSRVLGASRAGALAQLEKEGIDLTPEVLAELFTRANSKDPAETLAAGAVFVATVAVIFSDQRLKSNIVRVGESKSGINIYEFSYNGFSSRWKGVLAQELASSHSHAVSRHDNGSLMVDYSKIDVSFEAV